MLTDSLSTLPAAPTIGDEIPIERGTALYKIDYNALAAGMPVSTAQRALLLEEHEKQMLLVDDVPDCVATPVFNADGSLAQINHVSIVTGATFRTDVFTRSVSSVVEVRTNSAGRTLTITANLITKASTLVFGEEENGEVMI